MGNFPGEAEAWLDAGRLYLKAEEVYRSTKSHNYEDHIYAAVQCYLLAIQVQKNIKNDSLAAKFALEIAQILRKYGKYSDSEMFYEKAADLQHEVRVCSFLIAGTI